MSAIRSRKVRIALLLTAPLLLIMVPVLLTGRAMGGTSGPATSQQAAVPQQAVSTIELWATTGNVTIDGASIPIWGFADGEGQPAMLPGPVITVEEGTDVTVVLHNDLPENVSIIFPGQNLLPDEVGAAPGGTATYNFTATNPGSSLYESGVNPQKQVQMGLYGALIVRAATPDQAYDDPDGRSAFDKEAVLVLSEVDPDLHAAVEAEESYDLLDYNPRYFLLNGKAFPQTGPILAEPGDRVLFRYLNAGFLNHTLLLLGLSQTVIAHDGRLLNFTYETFSQTVVSGETYDLIATVPGDGTAGTKYPLYVRSRSMHTYQGDVFPGGMMTFVTIQSSTPDVDCDSDWDAVDAMFILQYVVHMREPAYACPLPNPNPLPYLYLPGCDAQGDGDCDAVDAMFILQCVVHIPNDLCPGEG